MTDTNATTTPPDRTVRKATISVRRYWRNIAKEIDKPAVIAKVKDESGATPRYAFMTCMSAGIAILGLLLSSPAVVIGAMLLSPLMGPILGAGFALATGDLDWLKRTSISLAIGVLFAVLFCALIVLMSPLQSVTEEIASRTRPNLFDLAVALFSALAGSYAMIRGREGTIVGVAIATALMPPLAVVGFGLATANWTVFGGSLLLFFTNLMTIALASAAMARLYGFSSKLTPRHTLFQTGLVAVLFIALAIPLGYSLQQIAWESNAARTANAEIADQFGDVARVTQVEFDFDADPIRLNASVLTPEFVPNAQATVSRALESRLGRPIEVVLNQYRVGMGEGEAEVAELAAARAQEAAVAAEQEVTQLADRLALIAGVAVEDVTIDRNVRRAIVRAAPLPDAGLETYYALERRVASLEQEWTIQVIPPARPLPVVTIADGEPDEAGRRAVQLAGWAASRIGAPLGVSGNDAGANSVIALLGEAGARAVRRPGDGANVTLRWLAPDQQ